MSHRLLTSLEVCDRLQISERKLRQLVADKRIAVVRSGRWVRFEESALAEFIHTCRVPTVRRVEAAVHAPPDSDHLDELVHKHDLG